MDSQPTGWSLLKFSDIVESVGATRKSRGWQASDEGADRYVGLEHLDSDDLTIRRWGSPADVGEHSDLRPFLPGDVIFGRRRIYQRKIGRATLPGVASGHALVFRAKPESALPRFLPYFLQWVMAQVADLSVGSLSPTVNWTQIARQEFDLPSLDDQLEIAQLFEAIDETAESLRDIKEAAFRCWRACSLAEFEPRFGRGPRLADHYSIQRGQVDPRLQEFKALPLIGPNHVEKATGRLLELVSAEEQDAISGKYHFPAGVVVYSKIRPELQKATVSPTEALCSSDMIAIISGDGLRSEYLLELLLSDPFTRYALAGSEGTGIPRLNRSYLQKLKYKLPPLDSQHSYLEQAGALHDTIRSVECRQAKLADARRATLRRCMVQGQ